MGLAYESNLWAKPIVYSRPFARYVIGAARARDQHVIVIVLTRASPTGLRLLGNCYTPSSTRPIETTPNATKNVTGRKIGLDLLYPSLVKSQVVLLQTAHSWANAGVVLGARMHRISHASGAGELSKQLNFRRYVLCCFPTNRNSHARILPIFARRYYVDIRRFERQRLKYTFALFRSHFE